MNPFDEAQREASTKLVKDGRLPVRRMAFSGQPRLPSIHEDGRDGALYRVGQRGLECAMPGDTDYTRAGHAQVVTALSDKRLQPVAVDSRAVSAMVAACDRAPSTDVEARQAASAIGVLAALPATTRLVILTKALRRTFWCPTGMADRDLGVWAHVTGLGDTLAGHRRMLTAVYATDGREPDGISRFQESMVEAIQKREEKLRLDQLTALGALRAARAYEASKALGARWSAVEHVDPLLRGRFVATGAVVTATDVTPAGASTFQVTLSEPCRLKAGDVKVTTADGQCGTARLDDLTFTDRLSATLSVDAAYATKADRAAATALLDSLAGTGGGCYLMGAPFLGGGGWKPISRWALDPATVTRSDGEPLRPVLQPLDMPLDVAVAGAPTQ